MDTVVSDESLHEPFRRCRSRSRSRRLRDGEQRLGHGGSRQPVAPDRRRCRRGGQRPQRASRPLAERLVGVRGQPVAPVPRRRNGLRRRPGRDRPDLHPGNGRHRPRAPRRRDGDQPRRFHGCCLGGHARGGSASCRRAAQRGTTDRRRLGGRRRTAGCNERNVDGDPRRSAFPTSGAAARPPAATASRPPRARASTGRPPAT